MALQSSLPELARRVSRALEMKRGAQFSSEDLALFASIGLNDLLQAESAKFLREQCLQRSAPGRPTDARSADPSVGTCARPSKLSGTGEDNDASDALAQARLLTGQRG